MQILGFNFTKINGENLVKKSEDQKDQYKWTSNIEFTELVEEKIPAINSSVLKVSFNFGLNCEPKAAEIIFRGVILLREEPDNIKKTIKDWKKKQLDQNLRLGLTNLIWNKCSLKALQLEEELGLPAHLSFPRITA